MVACSSSNVDIEEVSEGFISKVKKSEFIDAIIFYEEETDELSKKEIEELRVSIGVELESYLKVHNKNMIGDLNKSNRMLDTIEFIEKMKLESYVNSDLNEYKSSAQAIIKEFEKEKELEEKKLAEIEKGKEEKAKKDEEKKEQEEKAKKDEEKKEQEEKAKKEEEKKEQEEEVKQVEKNLESQGTATKSQQQAIGMAENYISYTAFSKSGLIEQLEFEGFDNGDATYAVDKISVNWKEQAVDMANNYLDYTSFSRSGLIEQLQFEGFSNEHATYAADQVGL